MPPWSSNLTSRHVKTPKYYPTDSGLAAHLVQLDLDGYGGSTAGTVVETFVFAELTRLLATSDVGATLHFYRDKENREIDFLLERRNGQVVGVEVKAAASVSGTDFRHLAWLRDQLGERFVAGYVLHLGDGTHSFGDRLTALPLSAMWHHRQLQS